VNGITATGVATPYHRDMLKVVMFALVLAASALFWAAFMLGRL